MLSRFADHPNGPGVDFRKVLAGSTHLQVRGQQMWASHEDAIAGALAGQLRADAEDPTARVLAHQVLSIHPMMLRMVEIWTQRGDPPDQVRDHALQLINRAFDVLEHGLGTGGSSSLARNRIAAARATSRFLEKALASRTTGSSQ